MKLSEWHPYSTWTSVKTHFLGAGFFTDDGKLHAYLTQLYDDNAYKYDSETFDKEFPGVVDAAISAIRDIESKQLRVGTLIYINGIMQAWCQAGFGDPATGLPHPPSKLCPNNKLYPIECR